MPLLPNIASRQIAQLRSHVPIYPQTELLLAIQFFLWIPSEYDPGLLLSSVSSRLVWKGILRSGCLEPPMWWGPQRLLQGMPLWNHGSKLIPAAFCRALWICTIWSHPFSFIPPILLFFPDAERLFIDRMSRITLVVFQFQASNVVLFDRFSQCLTRKGGACCMKLICYAVDLILRDHHQGSFISYA